jgi:MFS family permease
MEQMSSPSKRKLYYGWMIVGLSMISMSFWFGLRTSFSLFFVVLINQFEWGRAETAGVQSVAMFVYMIMAPIIGTLVDRIGPRKVIGIGAALGAWVAGYIFDQTQNYFWAFVLSIFLNLISILFVWFAAPRKVHKIKSSI